MRQDFNFKDKIVLITGSTRGIGRAAALVFLKNGATVIINGRYRDSVKKAVGELKKTGYGDCFGIDADISKEKHVEKMAKIILKKFGRINILVNNAGLKSSGRIEEISEADWDRILDINLRGVFLCCQKFLPALKATPGSKIINVASDTGRVGCFLLNDSLCRISDNGFSFQKIQPALAVSYNVAKGGVIALTKSLAKELAPWKINVNAACPGIIETDFIAPGAAEKYNLKARIPFKELGLPADVANLILFLASEKARYITGQNFSINGGMYMNF
jgi:NAD(P)-dependent dehydrogenase (short-subunit alcohol dehydrogenase family)